ncbi:16S rRNA pseudouridine516 synthase [Carnobacterium alterfunditum]|uniref:Pseudouridine synthase n=1 Tax=Carnobacterium alterfunditum TaxID=28230 RepID=A0A1N6HMH6_9LACT|nr:pseudouridine synthase [Carnobacterium alterfunditum]SIO20936.1 16S rRNA pseudouridine516 synthase [Carnobacterium alterfunditum]
MRLDKLLFETGFGSRRTVKRLIKSKQIKVNGQTIAVDNLNVDPDLQEVTVSGTRIHYQPHVYFMLHKPAGVVSAVSDASNQTVIDLIDPSQRVPGLFPVGRLDKDTEGLLLLTNNGQLGYQLLIPKKEVTKCYEAVVNERVTSEDRAAFAAGIVFDGGIKCKPAKLTILSHSATESRVLLEISEGKFHQVKKMFLSVGKKVVYLKRLSMGPLQLDETLPIGSYRALHIDELTALKPYFK